ncbi:MAG: polysaccharide deacetylase [Lachnospiraceae bacterium]|nr:polysaccharide deacetylase [Lachnospiraceae bacterium]
MGRSEEEWEEIRRERRKKRKRQVLMTRLIFGIFLLACVALAAFLIFRTIGSSSGKQNTPGTADTQGTVSDQQTAVTEKGEDPQTAGTENGAQGETEAVTEVQSETQTEYDASQLTAWEPTKVTHVFFHSLVVDPSKAFSLTGDSGWDSMTPGFCQWMTTVYEFNQMLQQMYDKGYILIDMHEMIDETTDESGTVHVTPKSVMVPNGKIPVVMSFDDLSYYHAYDNRGIASKVVLDENGKPVCEYIREDGTVETGDYDYIPILDKFLEAHPDFSWHGAKGTIALTGYNGILGYRTDIDYKVKEHLMTDQAQWLDAHPDFDWDAECAEARKVAQAIKDDGWVFASHTWGHMHIGDASLEKIKEDTDKWEQYVAPLIGGSDTIIFAHGQDLANWDQDYASTDKFKYLKSQGFDIFCNVDSTQYYVQIGDEYLRMGRRNLDGYRLWQCVYGGKDEVSDLFDASSVIDPDRPSDASFYSL